MYNTKSLRNVHAKNKQDVIAASQTRNNVFLIKVVKRVILRVLRTANVKRASSNLFV